MAAVQLELEAVHGGARCFRNASVSRYFKIAAVTANGTRVPFHLAANDGNIMEHAVAFRNNQSSDLPLQGTAERYDIVIDFATSAPGTKIYLANLIEHEEGHRPKRVVPPPRRCRAAMSAIARSESSSSCG